MSDINIPRANGHDRAAVNKANAQKSTGPRTDSGKQRSKLNALRHGLTGHTIVLPTEDHWAYQLHTQRFVHQFQPVGALEEQLVQSLADSAWRLNRVPALETNLLTLGLTDLEGTISTGHAQADAALAAAQTFRDHASGFAILTIYEQRISRLFAKTLEQLRQIQAERREKEETDLDRAADILEMHQEKEDLPYNPLRDGFVFSTGEIETFIERRDRLTEARSASLERYAAAG
jgi:hypothetical protein